MINLYTETPNITKMYELKVQANLESIQRFIYLNKSNQKEIFNLHSSDTNFLRILNNKIMIDSGDKE